MTGRPRKQRPDRLSAVWDALADPGRRRILDLLRERPRTTGELAEVSPYSRFAVMKHLGVLEAAGLIAVRREGRRRWNHLNAVPLQEIWERWVRPYEAGFASGLLGFRERLEAPKGIAMTPPNPQEPLRSIQLELDIPIRAPKERVWRALIEDIGAWWRKDFYIGKDPKTFVLEPTIGGRMYEDWGNGAGMLWYHVITIAHGERLELSGPLFPAFGGPGTNFLILALESKGKDTVLKLTNTAFGKLADALAKDLEDGWKLLLGEGFRRYVEGKA